MIKFEYLLFCIPLFITCTSPDKFIDDTYKYSDAQVDSIASEKLLSLSPIRLYKLTSSIRDNDLSKFNYHGAFYENRLNVYYALDVNHSITGAKVEFVTLYFVDSLLSNVTYGLDTNISNTLIDSLGVPGRIKHFKEDTVRITQKKKQNHTVFRLNSELKKYTLIWSYSRIKILFRARQRRNVLWGLNSNFILSYQLREYDEEITTLYGVY